MLTKLLVGVNRFKQSLILAISLAAYWISTLSGGRTRVRWARWAYALDHRNKLALNDLVERRPTECGGDAQTSLQQWAHSIVQRDPLTFVKVVRNSVNNEAELARASLIDWAYRFPAQDAISLFNIGMRATGDSSEKVRVRPYPWAYLAQQYEVQFMLEIAERAALTETDRMRAWLTRWAQSLDSEDLLTHITAAENKHVEDPRVDAFYALVAARTDSSRTPKAHAAQRFAVQSCDPAYEHASSQNGQDRFVLFALGDRRGQGFFVEFGATDGRDLSNTYLLEQEFGWNGIVAEPNPTFHTALRRNRRCRISDHCVWSQSGEMVRFQAVDLSPGKSTIAEYQYSDQHDRSQATTIQVPTITLNDLLEQHQAPRHIDYISVDTEGSELAILEAFDFSAYDVSIFTIEHNFTPAREKIQRLMQQQGYVRVFEAFSRWDDWYVRADIATQLGYPACAERSLRIAV